ncbi:MAG: FecR domain-containing protein [Porticoccaceae bacterium]|nr:FecR domain-containing protein [Porticoccaceae bacterium]
MKNGPSKVVITEACDWVARLETGELSAKEQAALAEWMSRSPSHAREIRAIARISGQLGQLNELMEPLHPMLRRGRRSVLRGAFSAWGAVGVTAAVVVVALLFVRTPPADGWKHYRTEVGEYQTVTLADGSTVKLNTNTHVEVEYSKTQRRIRLVNGEALFEVEKDANRPFLVYSGYSVTRAVGTAFAVKLMNRETELSVIEGVVEFTKLPATTLHEMPLPAKHSSKSDAPPLEPATASRVVLKAGQSLISNAIPDQLEARQAPDIPVVDQRDIQRKISWVDGLFDFSDTPLKNVVYEFNRHNRLKIEIADPELQDLQLGGLFRIGDTDSLLDALHPIGVKAIRQNDQRILLIRVEKKEH